MKTFLILISVALVGCSSVERTKYSDKNMRVMVDPSSLNTDNYIALQTSLVSSNIWTVVDRSSGLSAIKREQENTLVKESNRFEDKQKFAHWGKLYGVGAVIVAKAQCFDKPAWWNYTIRVTTCKQFLNMIDANTGEVIAAVRGEANYAEWDEIVAEFYEVYPKKFEQQQPQQPLLDYMAESEKQAIAIKQEIK